MLIVLFLLAIVSARYQFLAEQDIIDVITMSKDEANQLIKSGDGPSYNCTNTHSTRPEDKKNDITIVSKDQLIRFCYSGRTPVGIVTICPGFNVTIVSESGDESLFVLDKHLPSEPRFGDGVTVNAKISEYYVFSSGFQSTVAKLVITYICFQSEVMQNAAENDVQYSFTVDEDTAEYLKISLQSNFFCITKEEEIAFSTIFKNMNSHTDNAKSLIKSDEWMYHIYHKQNITQTLSTVNLTFNLGYYDEEATLRQRFSIVHRFKPSDPQDSFVNMIYNSGDECSTTGQNRTANVRLSCPSALSGGSDAVIETSHCHYEVYCSASWVCNLPWMKLPKRQHQSVVCYPLEKPKKPIVLSIQDEL